MSIEINKLQLGYQDKTIVRDLSLSFPSNQIIALIGPNGCGKSTTLKAVARLLKPRLGTITHKGKDIWQSTPKEYAKQLAFLPQQHLVPEGIKVCELIAYGRSPYLNLWGKLSDKDEQLVAWAMEQTHTTELAEHLVSDLSGGQQQRVSIARALMNGGEIILADEPTGALDSQSGENVMEILRQLHQEGHTIIMVTHDKHIAASANRMIEIKDGEIISDTQAQPVKSAVKNSGKFSKD